MKGKGRHSALRSGRRPADWLQLFLKGMAMGAADSVPGISGGTIAFITHIYDELIASLRQLHPGALLVIPRQGIVAFWQHINGSFLLVLLAGIVSSLLLLATGVTWLLAHEPEALRAFFFGLVLASCRYLWTQCSPRGRQGLWLFPGLALALMISVLPPLGGSAHPLWLFISGSIAICAMILPGISGAFILLLLGVYPIVMAALAALDMPVILVFVAGCIVGLLSFVHLLGWLLHYQRQPTLLVLLGILAGSLLMLWPWQGETVETASRPLLPWSLGVPASQVIVALVLAAAGYGLVRWLETRGSIQRSERQY